MDVHVLDLEPVRASETESGIMEVVSSHLIRDGKELPLTLEINAESEASTDDRGSVRAKR